MNEFQENLNRLKDVQKFIFKRVQSSQTDEDVARIIIDARKYAKDIDAHGTKIFEWVIRDVFSKHRTKLERE